MAEDGEEGCVLRLEKNEKSRRLWKLEVRSSKNNKKKWEEGRLGVLLAENK
jgi:hypothetical protein